MTKRFRLAVVGCGDIAGFIALVSKTLPMVKITACVSKLREEAELFAKKHHIPHVFTKYEELLKHNDLYDAVYLSTPHHLHASMIRAAVDVELPVFCEKPIAECFSSAKEIVSYVDKIQGRVGINYQYRYNPACQKLIQYTRNDIGQLYYIRVNIPWHRNPGYFDHSTWHKKITTAGGGTLLTQGSHFLDIALLAANAIPISAFGVTDRKVFNQTDIEIEDFAHGIVTLKNGAHIEITSSMVANPEQSGTIEVYGEKGLARFSAEKRPYFSTKGIKPSRPNIQLPLGIHPLARSIHGFSNWITNDIPYLTPIHTALTVMSAIDAIYRSSSSRREEAI